MSPTPNALAMTARDAIAHDPSRAVRDLTATAVGVWPKGTAPKREAIARIRRRIMFGGIEPIRPLYLLALSAVDDGKDAPTATQWARDFIALVEQYAARRERRQSAGVLSFPEAHARHVTRSIREDADADVATATVDMHSVASLRTARAERLEAIAADRVLVDCYTRRIAELVGQGGR